MAQFYTLEEAARVLGMSAEELKTKAQHREVRAFLDGGSWRFRVVDVDELARRRGMGSDAELRLSDLEIPTTPSTSGDDIDLSEFNIGVADADLGAKTRDLPAGSDSGSDHDILLDDLSLPPGPVTGSSSVIIGMATSSRRPTDSDVRLIPDNTAQSGPRPSDSDVRLAPADARRPSASESRPKAPRPSDSDVKIKPSSPSDSDVTLKPTALSPADSDVTLIAEDTTDHFILKPGAGDTAVRKSPVAPAGPGSSAEVMPPGEPDSDFELSPSSMMDALQPDSGSDFELSALDESDEFEATPMLGPSDSDVTAADPGFSGINLSRPSDSGINLQMASGLGLKGASSIELTPLSGDEIKQQAAKPKPKAPAKPAPKKASMAETPIPSKAEKDIFDDTDFEVDALDSDGEDKTMQLEAASDFELEESDTGSEVFAIDEEDVDQNAATALGPASGLDDEEEDDVDFAAAASGEMASAWDVESESESAAPAGRGGRASAGASPMLAAAGATAEWGGLWIGLLGVTSIFMLFLAFVSMDLVRNLYEFQGNGPASGIVKSLAGLVGG